MYSFRIIVIIILFVSEMYAQEGDGIKSEFYKQGIFALEKKQFGEAELYFEMSVDKYEDGASYYQLALLNLKKETPVFRSQALKLLKKSVWKEPNNITYRTALAELLEDFAKYNAVLQYEKILEIDESSTNAWLKLGDIKRKEFDEYYNSVRKMSDEIDASLDEYAQEDFEQAEYFYKKALETDPENTEVILNLALLYERKDSLDVSIKYLKKLVDINPASKEGRLYLGLCYNYLGEYKNVHREFIKAVSLMSSEEKNDFTVASVMELINPVFENLKEIKDKRYLNNIIAAYWKINDPLVDETVNERLLEHYSRVAYANLRFTPENKSIPGWKTDRGKTVLRYGIPLKRVRYRPSMEDFGVMMKTEVWDYEDMAFGFTDQYMSGNYAYSAPLGEKSHFVSQFAGDSHTYAEQLKNIRHQLYNPPFRGEHFEFDYDVAQLKNLKNEKYVDYVLAYSYTIADSLSDKTNDMFNHKWSINFFNNYFGEIFSDKGVYETKSDMISNEDYNLLRNYFSFILEPDSGLVSFKLFRDYDKGFSSFVDKYKIRNFAGNNLLLSDIILASEIKTGKLMNGFQRNDITLFPVSSKIKREDKIFLYYEIYNLKKGESGLTDFSVELKIQNEKGEGINALLSSIAQGLGLSENNSIVMTSSYQTREADPQIYLELNLSELPVGDYFMQVNVRDNFDNSIQSVQKSFSITEDNL